MKISVITINFNNNDGLEKTLKSVSKQTFRDFEHIVIDGGSNDGSRKTIERFSEGLSFWCSERDNGIYNAMNKGISKASGEYILFLNSGDFLYDKDTFRDIAFFLDKYDIVYGDLLFRGKNHEFVQEYPDKLDTGFFFCKSLGHPASFIKRSMFDNYMYSENFKIVSDWEFFTKKIIFENASYKHIRKIISIFDTNGISSQNENLSQTEREIILKRLFPGQLYEYIKELVFINDSPLREQFYELSRTRKFQYRIKPLIKSIISLNNIISGHWKDKI